MKFLSPYDDRIYHDACLVRRGHGYVGLRRVGVLQLKLSLPDLYKGQMKNLNHIRERKPSSVWEEKPLTLTGANGGMSQFE